MSLLGKKKEKVLADLYTQLVPVAPNDVIVVKGDLLADAEDIQPFIDAMHAEFPMNLVVLMGTNDTFETQPVDVLRSMLEDLIAHQEAVEKERAKS